MIFRATLALIAVALALPLPAQVAVTLSQQTTPTAGQPGVTVLNLTGSGFPTGTITPSLLFLSLTPQIPGPGITATVSAVTTIVGTSRRITFQIAGPDLIVPAIYSISVSGHTSAGVAFASVNTAALTVNPPASVQLTPNGTPIIAQSSPNTGSLGAVSLNVTLVGQATNFVNGSSVADFAGNGITINNTLVADATHATANITIAANATPGPRRVTMVTNGEVASLYNGFSITDGSPMITLVGASAGQQGTANLTVNLTGTGTHFVNGVSLADFGGNGITVNSTTVADSTHSSANLTITSGATLGTRKVTLTTNGEIASLANGFTVTSLGGQTLLIDIAGQYTNFLDGSTKANFGPGISVGGAPPGTFGPITVLGPTSARAQVTIDPVSDTGKRVITVATGVQQASATFNIPGTPVIIQVVPNGAGQGAIGLPVTITGNLTHFSTSSVVTFGNSGVTAGAPSTATATSLTVPVSITSGAATGPTDLTVTTGSEAVTLANGFMVSAGTVGISVTPSQFDFSKIPVNTTAKQKFTITSTGQSALTVDSIAISGAFFTLSELPSLPLVLAPNGTASFTVIYAPLGTFSSNATVTVGSNASTSPTLVTVSGTGTPPASPAITGVSVSTDKPVYRRAQAVQISGSVTQSGGAGISNVPVTVQVTTGQATRTLNPYTDASGNYSTTFQPAATDGGTFSVSATASSGGVTQTDSTGFRIFGFLINPSAVVADLAMGNTLAIPLDLQNVGGLLNNIAYGASVNPMGLLTTSFPQSVSTLAAGTLVTVPGVLTAPSGNPPAGPVTVQITVTATDALSAATDSETATFTITLHAAVSTLTLTPPTINVGVNPGGSLTLKFAATNQGFASTSNSTVTLEDPNTFNWVSLGNPSLGNIAPGASQIFQVTLNPPTGLALGNYAVLFDVSGGTTPLQGTINVAVTQSTLGSAQFTISDDIGAKVSGATVTLMGKTNQKTYQGVTSTTGVSLINGIEAGDYSYVVSAPLHDPGSGSVAVTANSTAQVSLILSYQVVSLNFTVTPTTVVDQYNVSLQVTYSTTLPKPALKVVPPQFNFSFFPEDVPNGQFPCSLTVTNTHPTAFVRNIAVDASQLDATTANGLRIRVLFPDGTNVFQVGVLAGKQTTSVACYAVLDGDNVPTHVAGNIVISGNFDFALDGQILQGTTTTNVPVTYNRPSELQYLPIPFTYDETDPAHPVLTYGGGSFVYSVISERAGETFNLLKPTGNGFFGHNLFAFTQMQGGTTSLGVINANLTNAFWRTDFSSTKQSLLNQGDTTSYDISALDNGLTLLQALNAQIAANPTQTLALPTYLAFEGQWSDRASPTGYLVPIQITTLKPDDSVLLPLDWSKLTASGLICLNPEDPQCSIPDDVVSPPPAPLPNQDGQIIIGIDQKIRLERQAFNVSLGIGARVSLTNALVAIHITDSNNVDASSKFVVLVTADPLNVTKGGTFSGTANVAWQLIPNVNAGGSLAQGTQYKVQATFTYTANGTSKSARTQTVTITVLPSPQLKVSYTVPFVVMSGKDAKLRVSITNVGFGIASNFSIQSTQPRIVDTTNPNLIVSFDITGASNTANETGFLPGSLSLNFGDIAPGATVSGYWVIRTSRNGFFIDTSSTFSHVDYQGVQLDPLILPPTLNLIPAIGGTVTSDQGPAIPNLTVSLTQGGTVIGSDVTDTTGTYYIPDLTAGSYTGTVTDAFGTIRATKPVGVLGDQGTSLVNFVVAGINTEPVVITSSPSGQPFSLGGNTYTTPQTLQLFSGSTYTIAFGSGVSQGAGTRYALTGWSDGSVANPRTITVGTAPATYNANFGTQYLLNLAATPPGAGAITATPASADGYYASGTQVQLGVLPTTGHRFIAFSGAVSGAATPQSVTMSGPLGVGAAFTAPVTILGVSAQPDGVPVGTPTTVTITVRLTDINTVIPGSINLISTNATGMPLQILGQLQPLSSQPDGSYGDFAATITVNESTAKALYFEISAAARGSLLRVVSTPLMVDVFDVPSAAQLQQISNAQNQAAAMFVQLSASLDTAQAAQQVLSFMQGQPGVKDAQLSPDAMDVWIDYTDGSSGIISAAELFAAPSAPNQAQALSRSSTLQPLASPASEPTLSRPSAVQTLASSASGPTLSPNSKALILAPFNGEFSPHDVAVDLRATFTSLSNQGIAAQPDFYAGTLSTVGRMKTLTGYGIFVINTHGGSSPNGPYIDTGEPMSVSQDLIAYREDLLRGRIVRTSQGTYGITRDFIYYYYPNSNSFGNSIVLLSACVSAGAATLDTRLADAFVNRGAGEVYAYRFLVTPTFTEQAGTQLFSTLANPSLPSSQRTANLAFTSVSSLRDSFTGGFVMAVAGQQDVAVPLNIGLTITSPVGGTVTSSIGGITCGTQGTICQANVQPGTKVTLTATADPGFQFGQWLGATCSSGGLPSIDLTVSTSTTCTASFLTAFNVILTPSGSYNIASAPEPYNIQLVDINGDPLLAAPQPVTVILNKQITSACRTLTYPNTTIAITVGATASLGFVAALDQCAGAFYATTTSWKITSAVMGSTPLAAVAGKDFLAVTRTVIMGPSVHITWKNQIDPTKIIIRQGMQPYLNSQLTAVASSSGGTFTWTPAISGIVQAPPSGSQINVLGLTPGGTDLILQYTSPTGQTAIRSVFVQVIYPIVLVHGFHADSAGSWGSLSSALQGLGLLAGDGNCKTLMNAGDIDLCAADFCDYGSVGNQQQSSGSCPYGGTLPLWGSFSSFLDEGAALKTMIQNLRRATGATKVVILAHSMGGLASRAYIAAQNGQDVERLITIGTPHGGTPLASVVSDPALAGASDIIFQGLKWLLEAGSCITPASCNAPSPAVQNMSSSPSVPQQSAALNLLNQTLAPNLSPSTQYVSIIGNLDTSDWSILKIDFNNLVQKNCFPVDSDGKMLHATPLCAPLSQYAPDVLNLFNNFNDGLVSSDSQNLGRVVPGLANTCSTFAPGNVEHAPLLDFSFQSTPETMLTSFLLQVLGLQGTPICGKP